MSALNVLMADDQALVLGAMANLLDLEDDLRVVAQVGRGDEVLSAAQAADHLDVCVLDIEMPGCDGIVACAQVRTALPEVRVVIVTTFARPGYLRRAMEAGADGYVLKDAPATELADTVRRVARGERVIDPTLAGETLASGPNPLTQREIEVLRVALDGRPIARVAGAVHLSPGTVRNYVSSAIAKTQTTTRVEAAKVAQQNGWI